MAAIVRSLIHPSDFYFLTKCFSHLDQDNKRQAFQLIHEVANEFQKAVLFFELNDFPLNIIIKFYIYKSFFSVLYSIL